MEGLRWHDLRRLAGEALVKAAKVTSWALVLAILNPFGIRDLAETRSHESWQQLYAPYYAPAPESRQRQARDEITIVLLDDASRNRIAEHRSIDSLDVVQMIDDIIQAPGAGAAPKALFIDILLGGAAPPERSLNSLVDWSDPDKAACGAAIRTKIRSTFVCLLIKVAEITAYDRWRDNPRCRDNNLAKVLCIEQAGGIPLLFADARPLDHNEGAPGATPAASVGIAALDRFAVVVPVGVDAHAYPLVHRDGAHGRITLSPAAALYAAHCERQGCAPSPFKNTDGHSDWSRRFDRGVDVVWGVDVSGKDDEAERPFRKMLNRLEGKAPGPCGRWERSLSSSIRRFAELAASGIEKKRPAACVYTDALAYRLLQSNITPEEARQALGGRIVLLGAALAGSNDIIPATPYGALPGVFLHAMALDNLIQRGAAYPKTPAEIWPGLTLTSNNVIELIAVFGVGLILSLAQAWLQLREAAERPVPILARFLLLATFAGVVFLLIFFLSGGVAIIPESFNVAIVAVVCVVELLKFTIEVFEPFNNWLCDRLKQVWKSPAQSHGGPGNDHSIDLSGVDGRGAASEGLPAGSDRPI